ncbi:MAG TPA: TonB-dependent receptor [Blastocatellia bacterium]|nr:TonB-dependent receptor [Blastocatellia bacterium]
MKPIVQRILVTVAILCCLLGLPGISLSQESAGSIEGVVTDPQGAVVPDAKVTVTQKATGRVFTTTTSRGGVYAIRFLPPGSYEITVEAPGFKTGVRRVEVIVGRTAVGDVRLEVGATTEVVTVEAGQVEVNTVRSSIEGAITSRLIDMLPLNGRNYLDLAQLEPGVQIVDAGNFDPTKNGLTGIGIGGRSGRTTRIQVDGIDITDEVVGTTTQNISQDALQEFQLSRATFDPSTSLTSSGAVNVLTRSGTNELHGSGFLFVRDEEVAAFPGTVRDPANPSPEFDREQVGFRVGGPFIKDKLFWFANYERTNQDDTRLLSSLNFPQFTGPALAPFDERMVLTRLDWNISSNTRMFARFSHNWNKGITDIGGGNQSPFSNQNVTNVTALGLDGTVGRWAYSARYGFTSFDNHIDASEVPGIKFFTANGKPILLSVADLEIGPDLLAPQRTFQTSDQWKGDVSRVFGNHTFRAGVEFNWIRMNVFAAFFGNAPEIVGEFSDAIRRDIIARGGNPNDPLEYPLADVVISNGLGFFSEVSNNGRRFGGKNNLRFAWYIGDTWRKPYGQGKNLTINLGLRYDLETGQLNDDDPINQRRRLAGLDRWFGPAGLEVRQDGNNFGPTIGIAWDPIGGGKTAIRAGFGIFYDTNILNNTLFERNDLIPAGLGEVDFDLFTPFVGPDGRPINIGGFPDGDYSSLAGRRLKDVINQLRQLHDTLQAAWANVAFDPNGPPQFLTNRFAVGFFTRNYSQPYSIHTNLGIQRELRQGLVMSVDYIRTRGVHFYIRRDANRRFAADTFDRAIAADRIARTLRAFGVSTIDEAIAQGATIADFGLTAAFPGMVRGFTNVFEMQTSGLSEYNALQFKLDGRLPDIGSFIRNWNMTVSYSLSRYKATGGDIDFINTAIDNDNILGAYGPSFTGFSGDRTHQLSIGSVFDLPKGFMLSSIWRFATAFPISLQLPPVFGGNNDIFTIDLEGDGRRVVQFLPGTNRGSFGRTVKNIRQLNELITRFNNTYAGGFTPQAQALINAGLFTADQLRRLGATIPRIELAPANNPLNDSFITTDVRLSKRFYLGGERVSIEPAFEVFNLFNVANYETYSGVLDGAVDSINGQARRQRRGIGSGSFAQGIPRNVQFAIRVWF